MNKQNINILKTYLADFFFSRQIILYLFANIPSKKKKIFQVKKKTILAPNIGTDYLKKYQPSMKIYDTGSRAVTSRTTSVCVF